MRRAFLKSKLHRATVTEADLEYEGSITIDRELMLAADLAPFERVEVYNIDSGSRFATYAIEGEARSGQICINGAAAHLAKPGDRVIIACYVDLEADEVPHHSPRLVLLDGKNRPKNL